MPKCYTCAVPIGDGTMIHVRITQRDAHSCLLTFRDMSDGKIPAPAGHRLIDYNGIGAAISNGAYVLRGSETYIMSFDWFTPRAEFGKFYAGGLMMHIVSGV